MRTLRARAVAILATFCTAPFLLADSQTFNATKDVNAKEHFPTQNFGLDPTLQQSNQTSFRKIIYVQFTVSGIPAGSTGITTQLKLRSQTTATSRPITAHPVTDTSWSETAITWNVRPTVGATQLSTVSTHNA